MTPEQTRFLLQFIKQLQSSIERCAATGQPIEQRAGCKITSEQEVIDLTIVAEQEEPFAAPIRTIIDDPDLV